MANNKPNEEVKQSTLPPIGSNELDAGGAESTPESREQALQKQVSDLQGQLSSVLSMVQQLTQKTGVKLKGKPGELMDGEAQIPLTYEKKVICDHKMKLGSRVERDNLGGYRDLQFIEFVDIDGKTGEMDYNAYQQMLKNNRIPVKIEGYIQKDLLDGRNYSTKKFKPDDEVVVILGWFTEGGERAYGEERVKVKAKMINAQ